MPDYDLDYWIARAKKAEARVAALEEKRAFAKQLLSRESDEGPITCLDIPEDGHD